MPDAYTVAKVAGLATGEATLNPAARLDTYPAEVDGADIRVTI